MKTILKKLNLKEAYLPHFDQSEIVEATFHKNNEVLNLCIKVKNTLPFDVYAHFLHRLKLHLKVSVQLNVQSEHNGLDYSNILKYFDYFVDNSSLPSLLRTQLGDREDALVIFCHDEQSSLLRENDILKLQNKFNQVGIKRKVVSEIIAEATLPEAEVVEMPVQKKLDSSIHNHTVSNKGRVSYSEYQEIPLGKLQEEAFNISVSGEIFDVDVREFRNGTGYAVTYYLHDGQSAIVIRQSYSSKKAEKSDFLKKGSFVRFYGDYLFESRNFFEGYYLKYRRYEEIEPLFQRFDHALEKRVEFHLHSKLSEMDGVSDVTDYIKQAFQWQHPGIVITDHGSVQTYPKAYSALKRLRKENPEQNFKLAYGVEMNVADRVLQIVQHPKGQNIQEASYIVFDIETTGLSAFYDHIIEFGAVKIENGQTVASYQTFIKPPVSIPKFIENLTNISDLDVKNAPSIDDAIDPILDFIGDSILVAHNASFDVDFMNEILRRMDRKPLDNTVIDTLNLSRALFKNRRSYRLGGIARALKINYDDGVAHRADYDAEILAAVFFHMKRMDEILSLETVDELMNLSNDGFVQNRKTHMTVIAKNQKGLKSLYELISLSYTSYLSASGTATKTNEVVAEPRIIKEEIEKRREDLLIGAGCTQSDIFEIAMNKSEAMLDEAIQFYDFIEIMPMTIYESLISRGALHSKEEIQRVILRIISSAKKHNKIIIASGNAHYNHPNEKVIRDIYIHAQGIGGTRHPLYLYDANKRANTSAPDQHFRTTEEMLQEFDYLDEKQRYQYVVTNTQALLDSIDDVTPVKEKLYTPSLDNSDKLLKDLVFTNAYKLYGNPLPKIVEERIEFELNSILGHGFGVIYYISHLLVKKSLDDGYLVGSRGSVGSSLVATLSEITEVNPLAPHYVCKTCHFNQFFLEGEYSSGYDLPEKMCPNCHTPLIREGQDIPFETFLGFEGDKVPDIDLNFSSVYQEVAHSYTKEIFGEKSVYRAGTISTVAEKTAFGYVLGYHEETNQNSGNRAWLTYLASKASGVKRTTGQHPGGIIVIPSEMDVHDFTPYQYPANNKNSKWLTTHFEYHDIESNVLKLDILGHVDPTAMRMLEKLSGIDINTVPITDEETISIFSSPDALAVDTRYYKEKTGAMGIPEFGTPFVRKMLEATKPKTFSDLVRISGLSHGTDVWNNNAETLIENGLTLRDVIGCRDDIMVYLMLHGLKPKMAFDIMESVRRGRGLTSEWVEAMQANNIPTWYIDSCRKIKYMFPKAHAVAYVMMAVRVAWFKVHRPIAYYAVYFTLRVTAYEVETTTQGIEAIQARLQNIRSRLSNYDLAKDVTTKERNLIDSLEVSLEMYLRGYSVSPIDLYQSHATEFIIDPKNPKAIIPPFNVIDGLGDNVANSIIEARTEREFISKQDLISRTALSSTLVKRMDDLGITKDLNETNQLSLF